MRQFRRLWLMVGFCFGVVAHEAHAIQSDASALSNAGGLPVGHLTQVQDSLVTALLASIKHTYPYPVMMMDKVIMQKPDTQFDAQFYNDSIKPYVAITPVAFDNSNNVRLVIEIVSHEVGHFLEPRFQKKLVREHPEIAASYGPGHSDSLDRFEEKFRDAAHHGGSIVESHGWFLNQEWNRLTEAKISESEFFGQYVAEVLGCYFSSCVVRGGTLSAEEKRLAQNYVEYLNHGAFDCSSAQASRQKILLSMAGGMAQITAYYHGHKAAP